MCTQNYSNICVVRHFIKKTNKNVLYSVLSECSRSAPGTNSIHQRKLTFNGSMMEMQYSLKNTVIATDNNTDANHYNIVVSSVHWSKILPLLQRRWYSTIDTIRSIKVSRTKKHYSCKIVQLQTYLGEKHSTSVYKNVWNQGWNTSASILSDNKREISKTN